MKKNFLSVAKCLLASMTIATSMFTTSCNDDDVIEFGSDKPGRNQHHIDANQDLTYGYNMMIAYADSLDQKRIELNTDQPVNVESKDGNVTFECVEEDGKFYLKPQLLANFDGETLIDKVTISVPGKHKDVYVSVRLTPEESEKALNAANAASDDILNRFTGVFSFGMQPWVMAGMAGQQTDVSEPMLNGKQMLADGVLERVTNEPMTDIQTRVEGSSLREVTDKLSVNAGISGILPCFPAAVLGFNFSADYETKSVNYYEYYTTSRSTRQAVGTVRFSKLFDKEEYIAAKYIDSELNDYLNNGKQDKIYPMTIEGTEKLLLHYGTHFPTYCVLGSQCRVNFRKKQDISSQSLSIETAFEVKKAVDTKAINDLKGEEYNRLSDKLKAYEMCHPGGPKGNVKVGVSKETYCEDTEMQTEVVNYGGHFGAATSADPAGWQPSTNPEEWVPVTYLRKGEQSDPSIKPIYMLCVDQNSERCKLIKQIMDREEGLKEYYKFAGVEANVNPEEAEWVIAGMQIKVGSNENEYKPYRDVCPDGKVRTFYPMAYRDNSDSHYDDWYGKCLDTEMQRFGRIGRHKSHVWYYALAMRDDCPGIEAIKVQKTNPGDEWINEMNPRTESLSSGWDASVVHKVLWLKPIADKNSTKKPITAVALVDDEGVIIGTTGGSEYGTTAESRNRYDQMWGSKAQDVTYLGKKEIGDNGMYDMAWIISQPNKLFMKYTTKPIVLSSDAAKIGICHPSNMTGNCTL